MRSYERLCVHCVWYIYKLYIQLYIVADDTLFLHTALSVLQTVHFVHTVYCAIYKREVLA